MDDRNIIYIDADTRKATLNSNFNVGVANDDSCHELTFRVNKTSDIDMTGLTFYVNTISSKGNGDRLDCTIEEDEQYIFVKCLLKGTLFEEKGTAIINLCAREYDENKIIKKWGSEDISVIVGSHTDADKAIEERYPSVLEDLKEKIDNPNISDEQLASIAEKVAAQGFYTKSQVDSLISKIAVPTKLSQLADDSAHRLVTDAEKTKWNAKMDATIFKTINGQTITGSGDITITSTSGTNVTVDTALSSTSTNPIQNKVVKAELDKKANNSDLGIKKITHTSSDTTVTINSGEYHVFPTMASLTIKLGTVDASHTFICGFEFSSGTSATSLTLTGCTLMTGSDDVNPSKTYEVNILGTSAIVRAR